MITMYGEQRQRELRQPAFRIHIPPAAIVIDSSVTEYNENILPGRIHVFTEAFNSAEFPMGIPCEIKHTVSLLIISLPIQYPFHLE